MPSASSQPSRKRRYDDRRGSAARRGYDARWARFAKAYRERNPLCRPCQARGRLEPTFAVDHIVPLRQGGAKFDEDNLQPLCETCHNSHKQSEDRLGYSRQIGVDGFPVDPRHPFHRGSA